MSDLNPEIKIAKSRGIDLPLIYIYLAGFMSKNKLEECTSWRKYLRNAFKNYKFDSEGNIVSFPVVFLDPFNGPEIETMDKEGITSSIPPNAIRHGDLLSCRTAHMAIFNFDNFGDKRQSIGTHHEYHDFRRDDKPRVVILPKHMQKLKEHPFIIDASWVVESKEEIVEKKIIQYFYKRMSGAIYE